MSEIPKAYEPQSVEDKWYDFWQQHGCFTADPARVSDRRPAYSIVIPPPNVTGMLHMGHVLNNTIQDILARKARMDGKEVLWLPGTDHAGIATQVQVEKALKKEERLTKHDLGREKFLERVWQWKEKHGGIIINQLKKLGCSCDWTRERFTMDPEYSRCVQKVFVELYKKDLIYRGKRMVNWCPASLTALSDEEVEMESQKGFLYYFKVQVAESPLTPALSPAEGARENCPLPVGETGSAENVVSRPSLSPLPLRGGEGQGEGAAQKHGPLTDSEGHVWLTIATTRPETIPGDTAIAVNPKDPRYAHLIGKHALRPLPCELPREQKLIPIIGDDYVDFEFGTGVLKVTPAHDKNDFEIGQRHKLAAVDIMNPNGSMNDLAGKDLAGMDRFAARKVAVEKLKELGALEKEEPYENKIGFSQRARVPIEPRLSEQWFLKYPAVEQSKACVEQEDESGSARAPRAAVSTLADGTGRTTTSEGAIAGGRTSAADGASAAAREGACAPRMRFHPQRWAKVYDHWLTNIQDWCISRQLWWGHRIPVWTKRVKVTNENYVAESLNLLLPVAKIPTQKNSRPWVRLFRADDGMEIPVVCEENTLLFPESGGEFHIFIATDDEERGGVLEKFGFTQDPDVLDTWFSSWLWPFATMGWPENTDTLKKFYPTTDLVTGPDIIFFWVARMIMAGYEYMGELPFKNVYFTGIIRDKQGRKMSKTLGNSPDPLVLIAQYGADALRFGTMRSAPLGQDVLFDEKDVELGRNFCNKLWNACRFRQMQGGESETEINPTLLTSDDRWILLRLDQAIREVSGALATYNFSTAVQALYRFFWSEYCDWYVEASKAAFFSEDAKLKTNKLAVMDFVLAHTLRLFHPFLPFITEELWLGMGYSRDLPENQGGQTIMFAPWPKPLSHDEQSYFGLDDAADKVANAKYELVSLGRNLRRELKLDPAKKLRFVLKPAGELPAAEVEVLQLLLNAEVVEVVAKSWSPDKGTPSANNALGELFLPTTGLIDFAAERARLTKELERIRSEIGKVQQKLANPAFAEKVPAKVLLEHQQRLADWQAKEKQAQSSLDDLPGA